MHLELRTPQLPVPTQAAGKAGTLDPGPCVACSLAEYPGPAFLPPVVINQPLLSRLTLSQNFYLLDVLLHLKLQTWPGLWIPDSLDLVSILF